MRSVYKILGENIVGNLGPMNCIEAVVAALSCIGTMREQYLRYRVTSAANTPNQCGVPGEVGAIDVGSFVQQVFHLGAIASQTRKNEIWFF